jgi:hypothetical protein
MNVTACLKTIINRYPYLPVRLNPRKEDQSNEEEQSIPIISKRKLLENIDFLDNYNEFSK